MIIRAVKSLFVFAVVASLTSLHTRANDLETYPKREMRAVWMASLGIDWPSTKGTSNSAINSQKTECTNYLDLLKAAGFNAVFFHVRPYADRVYKKNTWNGYTVPEPFSHYVSGTRGTETSYDPLEFWIQECHKRGMELHAWINPYRYSTAGSSGNYWSTADDIATYNSGILIRQGTHVRFNPALDASNERIANVARVLCGNYDIDGIVFDDYFYAEDMPTTSSAPDWSNYQAYKNNGGTMTIRDWRRDNVNRMVHIVNQAIKAIKPWVTFGIGPAGGAHQGVKSSDNLPSTLPRTTWSDWQYDGIYSDPMAWLRNHDIDYISPQLYWKTTHSTNPFGNMTNWWSQVAAHFGRHHYASHSISFLATEGNTTANHNEVSNQVQLNRTYNLDNAPGAVIYSSTNIGKKNTGLGDVLKAQRFQHTAATPPLTWYQASDPGMVTNFAKSSQGVLTWTGVSCTDHTAAQMRYITYVIPKNVSVEDARSSQGGFKSEYIIDIVYGTSISVPSSKNSFANYWYAVAPLDRYGNEWPATLLGAPVSTPADINLLSPANGSTCDEMLQVFSWSSSNAENFRLEISDSPAFSNIVLSTTTHDQGAELSLASLAHHHTYYWRVIASGTAVVEATSPTWSFTTPTMPTMPTPELFAPANNSEVSNDVAFVARDIKGDCTYLEIATDPDFSNMYYNGSSRWTTYSDDLGREWLQYTLPISLFNNGQYYWRVRVVKAGYETAYSDTWTFTITNSASSEYIATRDPYEYPVITIGDDNLNLTNLWCFSNHIPETDNFTNVDPALCRSMTARSAADQPCDIVYIAARTANSSGPYLIRYNADTGERMDNLPLNTDSQWSTSFYILNSVFLDNANNLCVANMCLAGGTLTIGTVNPSTGAVTTRISIKPVVRVDHPAIYGDITSNSYYVFAAGNEGTIKRFTVTNGSITETKTKTGYAWATAPRVQALTATKALVDGSGIIPAIVNINTGAIINNFPASVAPVSIQPNGCVIFNHEEYSYMAYVIEGRVPSTETTNGVRWNLIRGDDLTATFNNAQQMWTFPDGYIGGSETVSDGGDMGSPVAVLQRSNNPSRIAPLSNDPDVTTIFGYSPGAGLAAYTLQRNVVTGVDDISVDNNDTKAYYDIHGRRVDARNLLPGLYLLNHGNKTQKVLVK